MSARSAACGQKPPQPLTIGMPMPMPPAHRHAQPMPTPIGMPIPMPIAHPHAHAHALPDFHLPDPAATCRFGDRDLALAEGGRDPAAEIDQLGVDIQDGQAVNPPGVVAEKDADLTHGRAILFVVAQVAQQRPNRAEVLLAGDPYQ